MKKLSLLLILTIVLSFSFAFATDVASDAAPLNSAPITATNSGETQENVETNDSNESDILEGDDQSGDVSTTSGDTSVDSDDHNHNASTSTSTSKTTIWGAVLAIVIVVIIVALVALFSKND